MSTPRTVARTASDDLVAVEFRVNGTPVSLRVPARMTLSDALRENLGLTGTHIGCEHGVCGMCTILIDGDASRACLLFACQVDGAEIMTVEGLGKPDDLHPLQEAFGRHHGLQCGFCTPGFLMSSYDLLDHEPDIQREDLPEELSGVICRCTGYRNIIDAVDDVAANHRDGLPAPKNCGQHTLAGRAPTGSTAAADESAVVAASDQEAAPEQIQLPSGEPTIAINVTTSLESPPQDVARVFEDIQLLARCLPGAELTEELGNNWYRGRARVALGPIRLSFNGFAHLLEHKSDRMHVLGQAKDTSGGRAQAEIHLLAVPDGTGTRLEAEARVYLVGRIAGFGRSLAGDVSRRMFEDFAQAVDQAARGEEPIAGSNPPSAFGLLLNTFKDRFRRAREKGRSIRGGHSDGRSSEKG
ncbi:xanthine dehydrogenase family Fe-S subunit [Arthrobacter crystallopoietes]|jgi:aerobic-type carbon monoxide dehydrogenase small subunit (CoxS/CutS family)/carbon monoxide dehydrogenase subunit G|uniref:xanthine dehydrogenase family Fe-S subunit n=1 Tax=Crystallibacter crystallopoietes TaxID=37928 RepID=UPI0011113318|nr:2Fe-2S iron-sulfur cluster-binding protein [Arthrobacter crystallopoietes]